METKKKKKTNVKNVSTWKLLSNYLVLLGNKYFNTLPIISCILPWNEEDEIRENVNTVTETAPSIGLVQGSYTVSSVTSWARCDYMKLMGTQPYQHTNVTTTYKTTMDVIANKMTATLSVKNIDLNAESMVIFRRRPELQRYLHSWLDLFQSQCKKFNVSDSYSTRNSHWLASLDTFYLVLVVKTGLYQASWGHCVKAKSLIWFVTNQWNVNTMCYETIGFTKAT